MKKTDVCIIGAGASSLMCACNISDKKIIIIDKSDRLGKKILVTGNGRCNLTNINIDSKKYNTDLVKSYFKRFSSSDTINFFNNLGLKTYNDEEGRVYPISNTANSVLDVLRLKIEEKNIEYINNTIIIDVIKKNNLFYLTLSNNESIICEKLVIATGGNSNLDFLKNFKIPTFTFIASLGGLKTTKNKGLNNVKVPSTKVSLSDGSFEQVGEVLFKEEGISGIVIFNLSANLARKKDFNAQFSLDFLPNTDYNLLVKDLYTRKNLFSYRLCKDFLTGLFHKALNINILEKSRIDLNLPISSLTHSNIISIANNIKNYQITSLDILDNNQVFSGGIPLKALDENFMFKSIPNLYAIGEVLNVDAECGGFNLQWAWSSGYLCGKSI